MYLDDCVCVLPDLTWLPLLGVGRRSWYIIIIYIIGLFLIPHNNKLNLTMNTYKINHRMIPLLQWIVFNNELYKICLWNISLIIRYFIYLFSYYKYIFHYNEKCIFHFGGTLMCRHPIHSHVLPPNPLLCVATVGLLTACQ